MLSSIPRWLESLVQDTRHALRALRAGPLTTVSVVLTIALGIGAVTTMYGLVSRLLLQPPPHVSSPERVKKVYFHLEQRGEPRMTSPEWYACVHDRLRSDSATLEHAAAYTTFDVSVGAGTDAARVRAAVVSAGFWATLGTQASVGRVFADGEAERAAADRVAVLGHAFWQQRYGGDPSVIGRTLRVRGETFQIVGVTPRGFRGVERSGVDLWLPLSAYPLSGRSWQTDTNLSHVIRLAPGVTVAQADAELSRRLGDVVDDDAGCEPRATTPETDVRLSVSAVALSPGLATDLTLSREARVSLWLVGVAIALLAIACANVGSVLLLRALRRRREIAVRLALGMSRRRLASQLFIESTLVTLFGGFAATLTVIWGSVSLNRLLFPNLAWEPAGTADPMMVVVAAVCIGVAAFVAGLAPLLHAPVDLNAALQEGAARTTSRRGWLHRTLLAAQTALSVVLLIGAGLFLRSLHNIRSLDLGLDTDNVLVATVDFMGSGRTSRDVANFYEQALERVRALPGVERASLAMYVPLRSARAGSIRPAGHERWLTEADGFAPSVNYVAPDFFATTGTRIIEGRDFLPHERNQAPVLLLNEAMARAGWPGRSPIGECAGVDDSDACATIIGVVENARRFFLKERPAMFLYRPLPRIPDDEARALFVRVAPGDRRTPALVTQTLRGVEPNLPFVRVQTLGDALDPQIRPWRLGASVFTAFGVVALVLAAFGLYSALAYAVVQRTREIGVRVAVGARARDVVRLVVADAAGLAVIGIVAGVAISLAAGRWMANLLFDVSPRDPAVFAAVGGTLLGVALLAALVPSRRAIRVDPVVALRAE
jgi:predicted permease